MRLETNKDGKIILKEVYNGVGFISNAGEEISVCMRDSGFELKYADKWYEAKKGIINRLGYPSIGIEMITKERQEQIEKHGRSLERDKKENVKYQLSIAAHKLTHPIIDDLTPKHILETPQGWDDKIWHKMISKPFKERLIIAAALLAAEIDRISSPPSSEEMDEMTKEWNNQMNK